MMWPLEMKTIWIDKMYSLAGKTVCKKGLQRLNSWERQEFQEDVTVSPKSGNFTFFAHFCSPLLYYFSQSSSSYLLSIN